MTCDPDKRYVYSYRYSALGDREQKRELYSPKGDSLCKGQNYHTWSYYLLGAGGEQLAIYKGVQIANEDTLRNKDRRVYLYPHSFISGGILVTLPDSTKQFNVMDNLGSVRSIVSSKNGSFAVQGFDYKPFGDTLNADGESRIGFIGSERDEESRYFDMGARQYDPLTGRFLSIDPLFEKFPSQTPYQYAFNNPISFKDPTGFEPEAEQGKNEDELLDLSEDQKQDYTFAGEYELHILDLGGPLQDKHASCEVFLSQMETDFSNWLDAMVYEMGPIEAWKRYVMGPDKLKEYEENKAKAKLKAASSSNPSDKTREGDPSGQNGQKPGVKAEDEAAKKAIIESVEAKYQKYISFDDEGYVTFTSNLNMDNVDPKSNFAGLYELAANTKETFYVSTSGSNGIVPARHGDNGADWNLTWKQWDEEIDYTGHATTHGRFVPKELSGGEWKSEDGKNHIYLRSGGEFSKEIGGYAAHELYFHALKWLKGENWRHNGNYMPTTPGNGDPYHNAHGRKH